MKSMCLAALTGALAISTMAVAIDVASAALVAAFIAAASTVLAWVVLAWHVLAWVVSASGTVVPDSGMAAGPVTGPDTAWAIDVATA